MQGTLTGIEGEFRAFLDAMNKKDDTFKFCSRFVHEDAQYYISLYIAIRTGNWDLRNVSLKKMVPIVRAFDRVNYSRVNPEHLADIARMPEHISSMVVLS